jgi:DNA-binding MarR family transcriptional regulator
VQPLDSPTAGPLAAHPATTVQLGEELIRLVKLLVAMRQYAPALHPAVDSTHYPALFNLVKEPKRVSDLAGCVHADVSTVSRQVTHLVKHGLAAKVPDPDDRRAHRVTLTEEGRAVIDRVTNSRGAWLANVMADWSEHDTLTFLSHVSRFADSLEAAKARLERPDG